MSHINITLSLLTCSAYASSNLGLNGTPHFPELRNSSDPSISLSLDNTISSLPHTFNAWESLLDPHKIQLANTFANQHFLATQHQLSVALNNWKHWNVSLQLPMHYQSIWGDVLNQNQFALGDLGWSTQYTHAMDNKQFWRAAIGLGAKAPTSQHQIIARNWSLVDRHTSTVQAQVDSRAGDLQLSMQSGLDFSRISKQTLYFDASWTYNIGGFFGNELYKYGDRVEWSLSSQWDPQPSWGIHTGFWGDRDLADWPSARSAYAFGLGIHKNWQNWTLYTGGNWGFDNATSTVYQNAQGDQVAWSGAIRTVADFELNLGLSYKISLRQDHDRDGIADAMDLCPNTLPGRAVDPKGCEMDADHDGVVDAVDACPNTPHDRAVDLKGCEMDADHDGVVDAMDLCPATAANTPINAQGCPLDPDKDGIIGAQDQCPDQAETLNNYMDNDGCPDVLPQIATQKTLTLPGIQFKKGSDLLLESSKPILDSLALQLSAFPNFKIEIGGHTSADGNAAKNTKLSDLRAKAVLQYLVSQGVNPERLSAKGYGSSLPIADNKTEVGREQNRRVEFRRID